MAVVKYISELLMAGTIGFLLGGLVVFILFWTGHLRLYTLGEYDYMYKNFMEGGIKKSGDRSALIVNITLSSVIIESSF